MTTEKDLVRILREKQKECDKLQQEIDQAKYGKFLKEFTGAIASSCRIIPLFREERFNAADARYFGEIIGKHIDELYSSVEADIRRRQDSRLKKSEKRKARSSRKQTASPPVAKATLPTQQNGENTRVY